MPDSNFLQDFQLNEAPDSVAIREGIEIRMSKLPAAVEAIPAQGCLKTLPADKSLATSATSST